MLAQAGLRFASDLDLVGGWHPRFVDVIAADSFITCNSKILTILATWNPRKPSGPPSPKFFRHVNLTQPRDNAVSEA